MNTHRDRHKAGCCLQRHIIQRHTREPADPLSATLYSFGARAGRPPACVESALNEARLQCRYLAPDCLAPASPTCAATDSCSVWCMKNDLALMRDRPYFVPSRPPPFCARAARREMYRKKNWQLFEGMPRHSYTSLKVFASLLKSTFGSSAFSTKTITRRAGELLIYTLGG